MGKGVIDKLKAEFKDAIKLEAPRKFRLTVVVDKENLEKVAGYLRDELKFDRVVSVSGIHLPREGSFEIVYHLSARKGGNIVALKTKVPVEKPMLPSLTPLFASANWHERETHEMLGVVFKAHPDLGRLLLQEDWEEGYPLRRDFSLSKYIDREGSPP
jgi:NADH-quinone oxidoreductase subunit C